MTPPFQLSNPIPAASRHPRRAAPVTRQSDPHTWELIRRGVERDHERLHEVIVERIREIEST